MCLSTFSSLCYNDLCIDWKTEKKNPLRVNNVSGSEALWVFSVARGVILLRL